MAGRPKSVMPRWPGVRFRCLEGLYAQGDFNRQLLYRAAPGTGYRVRFVGRVFPTFNLLLCSRMAAPRKAMGVVRVTASLWSYMDSPWFASKLWLHCIRIFGLRQTLMPGHGEEESPPGAGLGTRDGLISASWRSTNFRISWRWDERMS